MDEPSHGPAISRAGLLASKSKGRLAVVWLHAPGKTAWAALHTVRRHGGRVEGVIVLELDVPRRWLRRNRRGLWYTPRRAARPHPPRDRLRRAGRLPRGRAGRLTPGTAPPRA
jgi:hypothetical protein